MKRSELVAELAISKNITVRCSEEVVNTIFDSMIESMRNGERIEIRGLGSFIIKNYGTYTGRNPKTGEKIPVEPKKLPFFKVGKELKERILNPAL